MIGRVQQWLAARSDRERRLLGLAATVAVALGVGSLGLAVLEDLATLEARVAAHERELVAVRRLAATVAGTHHDAGDDGAMMTRLQAATDAARLADRVTAMTPVAATAADGSAGSRLTVRVGGASLAETVHLLHALDEADASLGVTRLGLRKLFDDPRRFDVTLEIAGGGP